MFFQISMKKKCFLFLSAIVSQLLLGNSIYAECGYSDCRGAKGPFEIDGKFAYLYWGVQEDQLGFALLDPEIATFSSTASKQRLVSHKPIWDSGVRLQVDINPRCSPVGLDFAWTHFKTKSDATAGDTTNPINLLATTVYSLAGFGEISAQTADSRWHVSINEYTLDVDYLGFCNSCFSFNPYAGLLAASINQKQKIQYTNVVELFVSAPSSTVTRENHFYGIGPRFGIELNWSLYRCITLLSDLNFGYLVGHFHVENKFNTPFTLDTGFYKLHENSYRGRPKLGGLIGIKWNDYSYRNLTFSFSLAYEFQYWWQQWQSSSNTKDVVISGEGRWGDLSTNGLTAEFSVIY